MNQKYKTLTFILLILFLLSACSSGDDGTVGTGAAAVVTETADTLASTPTAAATEATPDVQTNTPAATEAPISTETATAEPTATQAPTVDCDDAAEFVIDITVPDDSLFEPNTDFVKTWRILNSGSCTWNSSYQVVHVDGDPMGTVTSFPFEATVEPGEILNVSINLVAPGEPGSYQGDWMFKNPQGELFGVGQDGQTPVFLRIVVNDAQGIDNGSISGSAWQDADFDNEVEAGEMLANVSITLSFGENCGTELETVVTDSNGRFTFENLSKGSYCLTGTDGTVTVSQSGIILNENQELTDIIVTWPPIWPDPASISGWVWDDASGDGMIQPEETYIAGVTVKLFSGSCVGDSIPAQLITETDSDGKYSFEGLQPGTYCVFIDVAEAGNAAVLHNGDWTFPDFGVGYHEIVIAAGDSVTPVNFGWDFE